MANKTDEHALHRLGTDPQDSLPPQTRHRIYTSRFWNASLFGVNLAALVPLTTTLTSITSTTPHTTHPSPFLCALLKLLQLAPEEPEIQEYTTQPHFKYPRVLAAFYIRLVFPPVRIYALLEPLLADYRHLVIAPDPNVADTLPHGVYGLTYVDAFIDALLTQPRVLGVTLPRLPPRYILTDTAQLPPRKPLI